MSAGLGVSEPLTQGQGRSQEKKRLGNSYVTFAGSRLKVAEGRVKKVNSS